MRLKISFTSADGLSRRDASVDHMTPNARTSPERIHVAFAVVNVSSLDGRASPTRTSLLVISPYRRITSFHRFLKVSTKGLTNSTINDSKGGSLFSLGTTTMIPKV